MKRLFVFMFFCLLSCSVVNLYAAEGTQQLKNNDAQASLDDLPVPSVDIDCSAFDCPIRRQLELEAYIDVRDCNSISDDRILRLIRRWTAAICERLQNCCRLNGCTEFECRRVDEKFDCVDDKTLYVKVIVEFKCQ